MVLFTEPRGGDHAEHVVVPAASVVQIEPEAKKHTIVERAINTLKNAGAVAAGYDKRGYVHLGTVIAAALAIRLRT
ncbi:hypothetical protein [Kitasatospora sp. NPDC059599]|uniref:hypothetical protein n=1 Tax=Kitasatospora sp. NPDC059599 TaxID=3346880 RepID=UPI00368BF263